VQVAFLYISHNTGFYFRIRKCRVWEVFVQTVKGL